MKIFKHFILITKHRHQVIRNAAKLGIFFQSLKHDLSKYSYLEFKESYKRFKGTSSPVYEQRKENNNYSTIAVHHTNKNKHHWEYYVDFFKGRIILKNIPYTYCLEYCADTLAASKTYDKKNFSGQVVYDYFQSRVENYCMTKATKEFISWVLLTYAKEGFKGLKKKITKEKYLEITSKYPEVEEYKINLKEEYHE